MRSMSLLGWAITFIVVAIIWRNPAGAGNFVFHTIPDHVSAFFSGA
jgi:hypothetical protein